MDEARERELMRIADEAAVFFKQLVRADVPVKQAGEMASAWILSQARKETITTEIIEPPDKKPWE